MVAWLSLACSSPAPVPTDEALLGARRPHELTVDCQGGADFAAVVDAVHAAHSGDLVTVAPCTYYGSVDLDGKALRIVSTGGPEVTTLAATPGRATLIAHDGEGPRTVVSGFTLTGGGGPDTPGGVDVEMASLRLEHAIVTGTRGTHAVQARSADLVLADVRVEGNTSSLGTAVMALRGFLLIVDSAVTCDDALHGVQVDHGASLVDRTTLSCPGAVALFNLHSSGRLQRSTTEGLVDWEAEDSGDEWAIETTVLRGGMRALNGTLTLQNSIIGGEQLELVTVGSSSRIEGSIFRAIPSCAISGASSFMTIRNNAFFQTPDPFCGPDVGDATNVVVDCQHVDPVAGDWRLAPGSPCIDAGPTSADRDVDGTRNDLGVYGGPMSQGGGW